MLRLHWGQVVFPVYISLVIPLVLIGNIYNNETGADEVADEVARLAGKFT